MEGRIWPHSSSASEFSWECAGIGEPCTKRWCRTKCREYRNSNLKMQNVKVRETLKEKWRRLVEVHLCRLAKSFRRARRFFRGIRGTRTSRGRPSRGPNRTLFAYRDAR